MPSPYQAGRFARDCDHANTHGIARSDASETAPPPRAAGRDPSVRPESSSIGVAARKYASNVGVVPHERSIGPGGRLREVGEDRRGVLLGRPASPAGELGDEAMSTAFVSCSRWRWAIAGFA